MKFIVFEGIDGCGKTTIIKNIEQKLIDKGYKVYLYSDTLSPFGQIAKYGHSEWNITSAESTYLMWATRSIELRKMSQNIENIDYVLADRYYDSTYVYQELYTPHKQYLINHNYDPYFFIKPDLTIYLQTCAEKSLERKGKLTDDLYETKDLNILNQRIKVYDELIVNFPYLDRRFEKIKTDDLNVNLVINKCLLKILKE